MNDSNQNIVSSAGVEFIAGGEANTYRLVNGNQWIAAIQLNGEFSNDEQKTMLKGMVESLNVKPCEAITTRTFLVKLHIQAGEYEKNCTHLISADNESEAVEQAILNEAHNDELINDDNWVYEPDYSFGYQPIHVKEVSPEDVLVFEKYGLRHA